MPLLRGLREVWLDEETDIIDGRVVSHLGLYMEGMEEAGASVAGIRSVLDGIMTFDDMLPSTRSFVDRHVGLLDRTMYSLDDVLTYFLYGRELIIPRMFQEIRSRLSGVSPIFISYLERHIDVDISHGNKLLALFRGANETMIEMALGDRVMLWDGIYDAILKRNNTCANTPS